MGGGDALELQQLQQQTDGLRPQPAPISRSAEHKCGPVSMATSAEETSLFLLNDGQRVGNTLEPSISIHLRGPTGRAT